MNRQTIACGILLLLLGVNGVLWSQAKPAPIRPALPPTPEVQYRPRPAASDVSRPQPVATEDAGRSSYTFRPDAAAPAESTYQDRIVPAETLGYAFNNSQFPVTDDALFEQQVRTFSEQVKQRIQRNAKGDSGRELELKRALDRYFAEAAIQRAVQLLQSVIETNPNSDEASKAAAAIRLLNAANASPESPEKILDHRESRSPESGF